MNYKIVITKAGNFIESLKNMRFELLKSRNRWLPAIMKLRMISRKVLSVKFCAEFSPSNMKRDKRSAFCAVQKGSCYFFELHHYLGNLNLENLGLKHKFGNHLTVSLPWELVTCSSWRRVIMALYAKSSNTFKLWANSASFPTFKSCFSCQNGS